MMAPAETPLRRRTFLYEIPIFYLLLFVIQQTLFHDNFAFRLANPNPFWLGILLFGLRYGLTAGFLSGLASAVFYIVGFRLGGQAFRFEDADFFIQPGLFIVFGAAIGATTDSFLHHISDLNFRNANLDDRNRGLRMQLQSQEKTLRSMEQQVVSQMSSIVTLYHGSRELGRVDRAAMLNGMMDFFTQALTATKTSIFFPENDRWVLRDQRGWQAEDSYPKQLDFTQGLIGRAGSEKKAVSLRDWMTAENIAADEESWKNIDSIMAGPLLDPDGNVVAVFSVQSMPFLRFNSANVNLLTLLLDWGNEALAKCLHFEDLKARSILDEDFGVYNQSYFRMRSAQEFARSKRHALPFSMLLVSLGKLDAVPIDQQVVMLQILSRVLRETVREIDIVAKTPFEDAPFGVLLMTATGEQAQATRLRVLEAYRRLGLQPGLRVGIGSYEAEMRSAEDIYEQARAAAL